MCTGNTKRLFYGIDYHANLCGDAGASHSALERSRHPRLTSLADVVLSPNAAGRPSQSPCQRGCWIGPTHRCQTARCRSNPPSQAAQPSSPPSRSFGVGFDPCSVRKPQAAAVLQPVQRHGCCAGPNSRLVAQQAQVCLRRRLPVRCHPLRHARRYDGKGYTARTCIGGEGGQGAGGGHEPPRQWLSDLRRVLCAMFVYGLLSSAGGLPAVPALFVYSQARPWVWLTARKEPARLFDQRDSNPSPLRRWRTYPVPTRSCLRPRRWRSLRLSTPVT